MKQATKGGSGAITSAGTDHQPKDAAKRVESAIDKEEGGRGIDVTCNAHAETVNPTGATVTTTQKGSSVSTNTP